MGGIERGRAFRESKHRLEDLQPEDHTEVDLTPPGGVRQLADGIPGDIVWSKDFGHPLAEPFANGFTALHTARKFDPELSKAGAANPHTYQPVDRQPALLATVEDETTFRIPFLVFIPDPSLYDHKIVFELAPGPWSDPAPLTRPAGHIRVVYPNSLEKLLTDQRPSRFGPLGIVWRNAVR